MNFLSCTRAVVARSLLILSVLPLVACGPQQQVKPTPVAPPPTASAEAALRSGNFAGAAAEYQRLAQRPDGTQSTRYLADAVMALNDAGDKDSAIVLLQSITDQSGSAYAVAAAAVSPNDDPAALLAELNALNTGTLNAYERNVYFRVTGDTALRAQDYVGAARTLMSAEGYALPAPMKAALHQQIWTAVSRIPDDAIGALQEDSALPARGWYALAVAAKPNLHDSAALAAALTQWQAAHAAHPANTSLVESLYELSESLSAQARHIALLLPFEGRFGNAARAVRDGFLSAWYMAPDPDRRPRITFYTVGDNDIESIYDTAVANGADLIVGPLAKANVEKLIARGQFPVRTMVLNAPDQAPPTSDAKLFQFGLAPEEEAKNAALRMWTDGHARAVSMAPQSAWGKRLNDAFAEQWQSLGGELLTVANYGGEESTYSQSVKQALNIDLSEARAVALRRTLNRPIEFEPRRRQDISAIFMAGLPLSVRQLMPQLRYFRAEAIPVYSTSHSYTGADNASADHDLDGLRFGDMPWLFKAADERSYAIYRDFWQDAPPGSSRLFAFGVDAYRILPYLARMRHQPNLRIPGTTGSLSMRPDGHVLRQLTWAKFEDGVPSLLDR